MNRYLATKPVSAPDADVACAYVNRADAEKELALDDQAIADNREAIRRLPDVYSGRDAAVKENEKLKQDGQNFHSLLSGIGLPLAALGQSA